MTVPPVTATADRLPHALDAPEVSERLDGRRPAVFLDYDGVLTPIVPRPEDAIMTDEMREHRAGARAALPGVRGLRTRPRGGRPS